MIDIKIHKNNIKKNNDGFIGSFGYNGFTSALPENDYKYDDMTENTNAILRSVVILIQSSMARTKFINHPT